MCCREESNKKIFVYQEHRSKLTLLNVDEAKSTSIIVDGCEINDNSIRCDFLHISKNIERFIELKGQDLTHAIDQIKTTINRLSSNPITQPKICYIICVRSPLSSAQIQNYKLEFRKKFNSELQVRCTPYTDKY